MCKGGSLDREKRPGEPLFHFRPAGHAREQEVADGGILKSKTW